MTGEQPYDPTVPPGPALPTPRRPGRPAVRTVGTSGSPDPAGGEAATEREPQATDAAGVDAVSGLNRRDLEVLSCLARGRSTAQIASSLSVSRNTARTRIRQVESKLDVTARDAAVRAAQDLGVLALLPRQVGPDGRPSSPPRPGPSGRR
jgi:DNA-binding CsgD family transcriptional regulator